MWFVLLQINIKWCCSDSNFQKRLHSCFILHMYSLKGKKLYQLKLVTISRFHCYHPLLFDNALFYWYFVFTHQSLIRLQLLLKSLMHCGIPWVPCAEQSHIKHLWKWTLLYNFLFQLHFLYISIPFRALL